MTIIITHDLRWEWIRLEMHAWEIKNKRGRWKWAKVWKKGNTWWSQTQKNTHSNNPREDDDCLVDDDHDHSRGKRIQIMGCHEMVLPDVFYPETSSLPFCVASCHYFYSKSGRDMKLNQWFKGSTISHNHPHDGDRWSQGRRRRDGRPQTKFKTDSDGIRRIRGADVNFSLCIMKHQRLIVVW